MRARLRDLESTAEEGRAGLSKQIEELSGWLEISRKELSQKEEELASLHPKVSELTRELEETRAQLREMDESSGLTLEESEELAVKVENAIELIDKHLSDTTENA